MTDHIGRHRSIARSLKRWYWVWMQIRVRANCREDYSQVPSTREWFIDAGYCLDNQTKGL
jgi:hypothetical protein